MNTPAQPRTPDHRFRELRRTDDPCLAQQLAADNMGLAISLACKLDRTGGRLRSDLIQEAHLGLLEAVRRFDPDRGVTFGTYATFWIRAYVLKFMRDNARLVRVGRGRADRAAYSRGELPPAETSLDAPSNPAEPANTLGHQLADDRPSAEALLTVVEVAGRSQALVPRLDVRERAILEQRLLSDEPRPLRQLARKLSLSGERVRQIEQQLLAKLRQQVQLA